MIDPVAGRYDGDITPLRDGEVDRRTVDADRSQLFVRHIERLRPVGDDCRVRDRRAADDRRIHLNPEPHGRRFARGQRTPLNSGRPRRPGAEPKTHRGPRELRLIRIQGICLWPCIRAGGDLETPGNIRRIPGNEIVEHHVGRAVEKPGRVADLHRVPQRVAGIDHPAVEVLDRLRHRDARLVDVDGTRDHTRVVLVLGAGDANLSRSIAVLDDAISRHEVGVEAELIDVVRILRRHQQTAVGNRAVEEVVGGNRRRVREQRLGCARLTLEVGLIARDPEVTFVRDEAERGIDRPGLGRLETRVGNRHVAIGEGIIADVCKSLEHREVARHLAGRARCGVGDHE